MSNRFHKKKKKKKKKDVTKARPQVQVQAPKKHLPERCAGGTGLT